MKTTEYILKTINRFPKRYIFTYKEFVTDTNKEEAVIKALNRMTASGKINKLCKGKFYKPEYSEFGYFKHMQNPNQKAANPSRSASFPDPGLAAIGFTMS